MQLAWAVFDSPAPVHRTFFKAQRRSVSSVTQRCWAGEQDLVVTHALKRAALGGSR